MPPITSLLKLAASKEGMVAMSAYGGYSELKSPEPKNVPLIIGKTAAEMAIWYAAPVVGQVIMGAELLYTAGSLANQVYSKNSSYTRVMRQSFSHSFTHTDATYQAQQRGIAAIGRHSGLLGAEAGLMASMYARR